MQKKTDAGANSQGAQHSQFQSEQDHKGFPEANAFILNGMVQCNPFDH